MVVTLIQLRYKKITREKAFFRLKLNMMLRLVLFTYLAQGFTNYSVQNVVNEAEFFGFKQNDLHVFSSTQGDTLLNSAFDLTLSNGMVSAANHITENLLMNTESDFNTP